MSKAPRLNEAIYHLEQHIEDLEKYNVLYDEVSGKPYPYSGLKTRCVVCGNNPPAILEILKEIKTEVDND